VKKGLMRTNKIGVFLTVSGVLACRNTPEIESDQKNNRSLNDTIKKPFPIFMETALKINLRNLT